LGSITYIKFLEGYIPKKTYRKHNTLMKIYFVNNMDEIILVQAIRGVMLVPKINQWLCNTLFKVL
jgi:hypothetical protein